MKHINSFNKLTHLTFFFSLILSLNGYSQIDLESGLVGYFSLNAHCVDSSVLAENGVPFNVVSVPGFKNQPNSAYSFDGSSSKINLGVGNRTITNEISISMWIRTSNVNTVTEFLTDKYDWHDDRGFHISIKNGYPGIAGRNDGGAYVSTMNQNPDVMINDGEWHHVLGVISQNTWEMWIDGQLDTTVTSMASNPDLQNIHPLVLGYNYEDNDRYFNGDMDEVRYYNRILTMDEISYLSTENLLTGLSSNNIVEDEITMFPNPVHNELSFHFFKHNISQIEIVNTLGKLILRVNNPSEKLDVSTLNPGVYYVRFLGDGSEQISIKRLVIQ